MAGKQVSPEILARLQDPRYFLENLVKIKTKDGTLVPFILNEAQKDLFNTIRTNNRVICLKARQVGFSSAVSGYAYHYALMNPGVTVALIGYNSDLTKELLEKVKTFYRTTPSQLRPTVQYNSKYEISFPKLESKIMVMPSTEYVGRGYTINFALCLSGETEVFTVKGTPIKVKDLQPGDHIFNGEGYPSEVSGVHAKEGTEPMVSLAVEGGEPAKFTEDHKLLTFGMDELVWRRAADFEPGDYIAFPGPGPMMHLKPFKKIYSYSGGPCLEGFQGKRVVSVDFLPREKVVYDVSMRESPHSFMTSAGVTRNCTELPFWDHAEEKMAVLEASVPINGKLIVESSPYIIGDTFYRMFTSDNDYAKREYGWWWLYSQAEVDTIRRRMGDDKKFRREYCLEFMSSGRNVFDMSFILRQRKNVLKLGDKRPDGSLVRAEDGWVIYKEHDPDGSYVMGADTSEGIEGGDYCVCVILDRKTGEEVAFFRGLLPPDKFAQRINDMGRKYSNALAVIEVNNHGLTALVALRNMIYPNIYFRPAKLDTPGTPWSERLGWKTTSVTRPLMIDDLATIVREGELTIHSKEILDEMAAFVYDDMNRMVPAGNGHDDAIFSIALAVQGFKVLPEAHPTQIKVERKWRDKTGY